MEKAWYYLIFMAMFLIVAIVDIVLLTKSINIIKDAQADGKITDEEKEMIKYSAAQAICCSVVAIGGIIAIICFIVNTVY